MNNNYYENIKNLLIDNEVYKKVKDYSKNKSDLNTYYEVGKELFKAGKHYGKAIVKEYSKKLISEVGKKYSSSFLFRIIKFYEMSQKVAALPQLLTWSHYQELLPIKDINAINYYIDISVKQSLSYRDLRERIRNKEYERLDEKTKDKLIKKEKEMITDFIKNPIIIKNNNISEEEISEKALKKLILEDIDSFLLELGSGFSYIKNEYKLMIGNNPNYIDLLLFNYIYNCFIVVELKVTQLKKEHIGQIEVYMNYIDKHLKKVDMDKTIGIIICKKDNKLVLEYISDPRIYSSTYLIK